MIDRYSGIAPRGDLLLLRKLGERLKGRSFLHINSTRAGGGVAEILQRMMPILADLGIEARWEVIGGDEQFFDVTKKFHNALQGKFEEFSEVMLQHHFEVNRINSATLNLEADAVLIHDPQPVALIEFKKNGKWIWRCHIDVADPVKEAWNHLKRYCNKYDAAVFSASKFARAMPIDEFIIAPSIDPLSDKNRALSEDEIRETAERLQIPLDRPVILQVEVRPVQGPYRGHQGIPGRQEV